MLPDLCQPGKTRQAVVFKDDRKRTFLNAEGADKPLKSPVPREHYGAAIDQIGHNLSLIRDGVSFAEFNDKSWRVPARFQPYRYSMAVHGVGMADEWPVVLLHTDFEHSHGGRFEKNMVVCVESPIAESGTESIKLETQVWLPGQMRNGLTVFRGRTLVKPACRPRIDRITETSPHYGSAETCSDDDIKQVDSNGRGTHGYQLQVSGCFAPRAHRTREPPV